MNKIEPVEPSTKSLYTKGTIYQAIATSENPDYKKLDDNAVEEALNAYKKIMEVETSETSVLRLQTESKLDELYRQLLNIGNDFYNKDDMESTVDYFYQAGLIFETDTIGLSNAFLVAAQNDMTEKIDMIGKELMKRGTGNEGFYPIYANEFRKKEDFEGLLKVAEAGAKAYPSNTDMGKLMVEAYSKLDRIDDAIVLLEEQAKNSNEAILYANLAILYENKGNEEKLVENYKKALEINPEDYGVNYNMGAYYYNKAVEIAKERNNLPANNRGEFVDQAKAKELMEEIKEIYGKSEPYFVKAVEIGTDVEDKLIILSMLSQMYYTMEMEDKQKEVNAKIKALEE